MLQSSAIEEALKFIASHPEIALKFLNAELEMPNIPTPTMGGHRFWTTLAEFNGLSSATKPAYTSCQNFEC